MTKKCDDKKKKTGKDETKVDRVKEPKAESNNYADRLFTQVDDAITKYLSNIENNRNEEYIRMDLFKTRRMGW